MRFADYKMNALDFIILSIIFLSGLFGFSRGFIRGVFSLLSLVLGLLFAVKFYQVPAHQLSSWVNDLTIRNLIGFIFIFIGVSLVITLIGIIIRRVFTLCKLGALDRVLGVLFGFLKGIFVSMVIIFLLIFFLPHNHPLLIQSKLSLYLVGLGEVSLEAVPDKIKNKINNKKKVLFDYWKSNPALLKGGVGPKPEVVTPKEKK
jgi:membrane protein required for colicin V production